MGVSAGCGEDSSFDAGCSRQANPATRMTNRGLAGRAREARVLPRARLATALRRSLFGEGDPMRARTLGRGWIATGGCTVLVLSAACVGNIGEHGQGGPADGTIPTLGVDADTIAASGLRRLTA